MRLTPRVLVLAALAAGLWLGIGVVQRTRAGASLADAALAELPSTLVVLGVALLWVMLSGRRRGGR